MEPSSSAPQNSNSEEPITAPAELAATPGPAAEPVITPPTSPAPQVIQPSVAPSETTSAPSTSEAPLVSSPPSTPAVPATPVTPASTPADSKPQGMVSPVPPTSTLLKKKWFLPLVIAALVVLLAGGYVFGYYLPSKPGAVYGSSLKNSGKAVDKLVAYAHDAANKDQNGLTFNASLKANEGGSGYEGTLTGSFDKKGTGSANLSADIMGLNASVEVRSIRDTSNKSPDIYIKATGVKQYLDLAGLSTLDNLDGQWIAVDHTLIDSYGSILSSETGAGSVSSLTATPDQLNDAAVKIQEVNKKYIFSTNSSTAVLKKESYIGKETKDGRSTYHYKVGYNKAHLQAYVGALKTAVNSSTLNDWAKKTNNGKTIGDVMGLDDLQKEVGQQKGNYTFDMWADTKTKLVHTIQFADPNDKNSLFSISQNYTGGDTYPFTLGLASKGTEGTSEKATISINIDTKTNKVSGVVTADVSGQAFNITYNVSPTTKTPTVTVPAGAIPAAQVLTQFDLGATAASLPFGANNTGLSL